MDFEHILDDLFLQLNQCRRYPKKTAQKLQQLRPAFEGKTFKGKFRTRQGITALQNLINTLSNRQQSKQSLKWSFALHMAADQQASFLGKNGIYTAQGTQNYKSLIDRVSQYAIIKGRIAQIYQFGGRTPQQILQELLIDDGLASRKRRNTLLDPIFKFIGIGCSYHQTNHACTVIILVQDLISLIVPDKLGKYKKITGLTSGQQKIIKNQQHKQINNIMGQLLIKDINRNDRKIANDLQRNTNQNVNNEVSNKNTNFQTKLPHNIETQQNIKNAQMQSRPLSIPFDQILQHNGGLSSNIASKQIKQNQQITNSNKNSIKNQKSMISQNQSKFEYQYGSKNYTDPITKQLRQGSVVIYQPNNQVYHPSLNQQKSNTSRIYNQYTPNVFASQTKQFDNNQSMHSNRYNQNTSTQIYKQNQYQIPSTVSITQSQIPKPSTPFKKQQKRCAIM